LAPTLTKAKSLKRKDEDMESKSQDNGRQQMTVYDERGDSIDRAAARIDETLNPTQGERVKFNHETGGYESASKDLMQEPLATTDPNSGRRLEVVGVHETWGKFPKDDDNNNLPPIWQPVVNAEGHLIRRENLGDGYSVKEDGSVVVDKSKWGKYAGQIQDPWLYYWLLYLYDDLTCEMFTLQMKSKGGRLAWFALVSQIKERRRRYPGARPIIELRWAKMPTKFGEKKKPFFQVCGWKIDTTQIVATEPAQIAASKVVNDLDDDELPI
jgi:hypothetical protein